MPTFIYAPGVKVYVQTAKHGLVDVSEDLGEGTMVRRSDGVSTFNFTISNPRRKYDSVFTPNDRVVCVMKRLHWVRTFTGLLNSVPLVTIWPRDVPLAASCSLKRLQYWYWDPHSAATQNMIRDALQAVNGQRGNTDAGVTNLTLTILEKVVGWPKSKVHIARIPDQWFDVARKVAEQVDAAAEQADQMAADFYATLGGDGVIAGATTGVVINGRLQAGTYGGTELAGEQLRNAETIYSVAKKMGLSDRDAMLGLMCAMQESQLKNLSGGDRDSVGLFQQRPSEGWGTVAQCTNPTYAATKFFNALKGIGNRDGMQETQAIQAVQRSGYPDAYQKWKPLGEAIVRVLTGLVNSTNPLQNDARFQANKDALTKDGTSRPTGQGLAQVGVDFVTRYPHVMYQYGSRRDPSWLAMDPPGSLDCSAFVSSMFFRLTGTNLLPPQTDSMVSWLRSNNGKMVSAEVGMQTAGAIMFVGTYPGTTHVEISMGDGVHTVGTRRTGTPASVVSNGPGRYSFGYLVPNLSYDGNVAVDAPGATGTNPGAALQQTTGSDAVGYNPNDPFDKLFGNNSWHATSAEDDAAMQLSGGLTGIRALLNDEPLLPYLKNLFNSTMRSFCSAPNGDLIAWFPDYYGLWGTAAKMVIETIELQDFNVEWSDDFFVTHQFTLAGQVGATTLDVSSGDIADPGFAQGTGADIRTTTLGIASIDIPAMMYALFGIDASEQEARNFADYIYKRFGARPSYQPMPGLQGPKAEFFSAMFMFMRQWAYQYNADIPLTFMPELFPGMLIQVPALDFQAYVTTVTHTFRFGQGGGFSTTVNIAAPARMPKQGQGRDNVLIGLPLAGDYKPGRGTGNVNPAGDYTELPNGKPILR